MSETTAGPEKGAPAATTAPASRSFGLRGPSPDPQLESLLALARWLHDDIDSAVLLSSITGPEIRSRFPAGEPKLGKIACRSGLVLEADMSDIFAASAAFGSLQEADDFRALMSVIRPGAVVVDVGANFGLYTAHAALYAGQGGRVFGFEPHPDAFDILKRNLADNGLQAMPVRAAVGSQPGRASFRMATDSSFSGLRDTGRSRTQGEIEVEVITLDGFEPLGGLAADVIKIDVEGGEEAVLRGARRLLGRSPDALVMFEFSYKNLDEAGRSALIAELQAIEQTGYQLFAKAPAEGLRQIRPDELQGQLSDNLFLARPQGAALSRLRIALAAEPDRPGPDQQAALLLLKRFRVLWRANEQLENRIRTLTARAGAEPGADALSNLAVLQDALKQAGERGSAGRAALQQKAVEGSAHRATKLRAELEAMMRVKDELTASLQSHRQLADRQREQLEEARKTARDAKAEAAGLRAGERKARSELAQAEARARKLEDQAQAQAARQADGAGALAAHRQALKAKEAELKALSAELAQVRAAAAKGDALARAHARAMGEADAREAKLASRLQSAEQAHQQVRDLLENHRASLLAQSGKTQALNAAAAEAAAEHRRLKEQLQAKDEAHAAVSELLAAHRDALQRKEAELKAMVAAASEAKTRAASSDFAGRERDLVRALADAEARETKLVRRLEAAEAAQAKLAEQLESHRASLLAQSEKSQAASAAAAAAAEREAQLLARIAAMRTTQDQLSATLDAHRSMLVRQREKLKAATDRASGGAAEPPPSGPDGVVVAAEPAG